MNSTPSQTAGPFVSIGTEWLIGRFPAATIAITGLVLDGTGAPVTDAMLEFWQADAAGRFPPDSGAGWLGLTRALTDDQGRYRIATVKPGAVEGWAPHVDLSIFARGLMQRLVTRIYFDDEAGSNAIDPLLASLEPSLRDLLIARHTADDSYVFDIRMQGERETVFFEPFAS